MKYLDVKNKLNFRIDKFSVIKSAIEFLEFKAISPRIFLNQSVRKPCLSSLI